MNRTMAIARKEWKAAFLSPVALIFLAIFLYASLFVFFFMEGFFARSIADAKPFFRHMPLLLVLLASAFTMRLWSDEARTGTMEVLLTLPLRIREVVLGKFLAGLGLVVVALALTLPVPISISILGNLDWGPVIGGYLGLILLAASYLAIGMLVSSFTSSQLVALMLSSVICGALVGLGYIPEVLSLGMGTDEILRALGTGSRFSSMLRGVLDLSDLVYYLSLAGFALAANALVIESGRWGKTDPSRKRRKGMTIGITLLVANLLVLNIGLGMVHSPRFDLTEWDEYSISPATISLVKGAQEPLLIRGYFSNKTHPLLDPLIPRIKDFLDELRAVGGDNLQVEFVDPTQDDDVAKEAKRDYGINPVPFHFSDSHADSVVNAYFDILVRYGDRYEVLKFQDLIEVDFEGNNVKVRLRNLEYDVAKAIQKTVYGFKSLETICKQLPDKANLKVIASSANLPKQLEAVPGKLINVAKEIKRRCGEQFSWSRIDPDDPSAKVTPELLYKQYGIKPMMVGLLDQRTFYLDLVLDIGGHKEILGASGNPNESEIKKALQAALSRHVPGFLKTVGIAAPEKERPRYPGMPPTKPTYERLQKHLSETYEVRAVDLKKGSVPGDIDVLFVLDPENLGDKAKFAMDQFLMRGGSLIIATSAQTFAPGPGGGLSTRKTESGIADMLKTWGVEVGDAVVLDEQNSTFPVPVERKLGGGMRIREVHMLDYPPFALIKGKGLASDNPATSALSQVIMHFPSSVSCLDSSDSSTKDEKDATSCRTLLSSSDKAWQDTSFKATPDYENNGKLGFAAPSKRQRFTLAVTKVGRFTSSFKGKQAPLMDDEKPGTKKDTGKKDDKDKLRAGILEQSPDTARLVVLGSSSFISDIMLGLSEQISQAGKANEQFMTNLVDWAVQDSSLLQIRAKQRYARTIDKLDTGEKVGWELGNFGFATLAVLAIGLLTLGKRKRAKPLPLGQDKQSSDKSERG